jgi:hypothetical protein
LNVGSPDRRDGLINHRGFGFHMISPTFQEVLGIHRLGTQKFDDILMCSHVAVRPKCQEYLQQPISRTLRDEAQGAMSADSADVYGRILMPQLC